MRIPYISGFIRAIIKFNERISNNKWNLLFSFAITFSIFTNIVAIGFDLENGNKIYNEFKNNQDEDIQNYIASFKEYQVTGLSPSGSMIYGLWWWFFFGVSYFFVIDKWFYNYDSSKSKIGILIFSMILYIIFTCKSILNPRYNLLKTNIIAHSNMIFFIFHTLIFGVITLAYLSVIKNLCHYNDRKHIEFDGPERVFIELEYKQSMEIVQIVSLAEITFSTTYAVFVLKDLYKSIPKIIKQSDPFQDMDRFFLIRFFLFCLTYTLGIIMPYMIQAIQIKLYLRDRAENNISAPIE